MYYLLIDFVCLAVSVFFIPFMILNSERSEERIGFTLMCFFYKYITENIWLEREAFFSFTWGVKYLRTSLFVNNN